MKITLDFDTRQSLFSLILVEDYKNIRREMIEYEAEGYLENEEYLSLVKYAEAMRVMFRYYVNMYNLSDIEAQV